MIGTLIGLAILAFPLWYIVKLAKGKSYYQYTLYGAIACGLAPILFNDEGGVFAGFVTYFWLNWSLLRISNSGKILFFLCIAGIILTWFICGRLDAAENPSRFKILPDLDYLVIMLIPIPTFLIISGLFYSIKTRNDTED